MNAVNLFQIRIRNSGSHFEPVMNANYSLVAPLPTRQTAIGGYPIVVSYDMLGVQLHYSNPANILNLYITDGRSSGDASITG